MLGNIIVICNQKGGPGKTTIALNLGVELHYKGFKTLLVDGDPQGSLLQISAQGSDELSLPVPVVNLYKSNLKIHKELEKFVDTYDYIIVDCPPNADAPILKSALLVANLAIVVFFPSSMDAMAAPMITDAIETAKISNEELKSCLLINKMQHRNLTKDVINQAKEFNIDILSARIIDRAVYAESPYLGISIHNLKSRREKIDPALKEIQELTDEILKLL